MNQKKKLPTSHRYSLHRLFFTVITAAIVTAASAGDTITTPVSIFGFGELSSNVVFSSDGKQFATRGSDGRAFLWDTDKGRVIATFDTIGDWDTLRCLALSPDGMKLLTAGGYRDSIAKMWDVPTGACLYTLHGKGRIYCVAFSADGTRALTAEWNESRLWDVATGSFIQTLPEAQTLQRHGAVFSADGKTILTAGHEQVDITCIDSAGEQKTIYLKSSFYSVSCTNFSPDGSKIVAASDENPRVFLCDVDSGDTVSFFAHEEGVTWVEFSPDGSKLVTASLDSTAKLWDLTTHECLYTFTGHTAALISASFSPDGETVLTAALDNLIKEWDTGTGVCLRTIGGHTGRIRAVEFSPDGTQLLMTVDPEYAYIWDVATVTCRQVLAGHWHWVFSCAWSPDGSKVATGAMDDLVKIWDAATGACLKSYEMESSAYVVALCWSPDGTKILAVPQDRNAELWDVTTDSFIQGFNGGTDVGFSPDGTSAVTASRSEYGNDATVWDITTGKEIVSVTTDGATCYKAAFLPDGKTFATASGYTVEVWDAATGRCRKKIEDLSMEINAFLVAPDGNSFFIDNASDNVQMWSFTDSSCIKTLKGHRERIKGVDLSPDGRYVITCSEDRTARMWDLGDDRIAVQPVPFRYILHKPATVTPVGNNALRVIAPEGVAPSTVRVFRLNGQTTVNLPVKNGGTTSLSLPQPPGVYLYRLTTPGAIAEVLGRFVTR
ncbi:MAG: WD40 repeat domain-containing protein [Chitinispirillaceae bacterium]|nr:WD40 repeat domain-containing protein [Chitinispirillaceae bacterium]